MRMTQEPIRRRRREWSKQERLMREGGYIKASRAATALGVNITTIYRQVENRKLVGVKAGSSWYISIESLLENYADAPPILDRIVEACEVG